jgi:hypothetical protein
MSVISLRNRCPQSTPDPFSSFVGRQRSIFTLPAVFFLTWFTFENTNHSVYQQ